MIDSYDSEIDSLVGPSDRVCVVVRVSPGHGKDFKDALDEFLTTYVEENRGVRLMHIDSHMVYNGSEGNKPRSYS